ncbi:hypothetical protein ACHAWF_001720 [Thalassiosira exigua]
MHRPALEVSPLRRLQDDLPPPLSRGSDRSLDDRHEEQPHALRRLGSPPTARHRDGYGPCPHHHQSLRGPPRGGGSPSLAQDLRPLPLSIHRRWLWHLDSSSRPCH